MHVFSNHLVHFNHATASSHSPACIIEHNAHVSKSNQQPMTRIQSMPSNFSFHSNVRHNVEEKIYRYLHLITTKWCNKKTGFYFFKVRRSSLIDCSSFLF